MFSEVLTEILVYTSHGATEKMLLSEAYKVFIIVEYKIYFQSFITRIPAASINGLNVTKEALNFVQAKAVMF